jgi:ATP-dependent Clp protease ATP-binding subunit ClpA
MTRCETPGGGNPPAGTIGTWLDPDADAAWRAANRAALELRHRWVGTEHLLLGLLHGADAEPARRLLTAHGVTLDRAREALRADVGPPGGHDDAAVLAMLGIDLEAVRVDVEEAFGPDAIDRLYARRRRDGHRLGRGPLCGTSVAPRLKRVLEQAHRAAKAEHRARAGTLDLLAGWLTVDGGTTRLLHALGVDRASLQAQLRPRRAG